MYESRAGRLNLPPGTQTLPHLLHLPFPPAPHPAILGTLPKILGTTSHTDVPGKNIYDI